MASKSIVMVCQHSFIDNKTNAWKCRIHDTVYPPYIENAIDTETVLSS